MLANIHMAYFDARHLPQPTSEYVAWIDVMGIQSAMAKSIQVAANFVFKLHVAALEAKTNGISLYPVMDGVYVSTPSKVEMAAFLRAIFMSLSQLFRGEAKHLFRFVVRGAVAFGQVYHGKNLGDGASNTLAVNADYRSQILLGEAMVAAHVGERKAPPFGIFVHPTARGDELTVGTEGWWRWFEGVGAFDQQAFAALMKNFYAWCFQKHADLNYEPDRILVHKGLAEIYLSGAPVG